MEIIHWISHHGSDLLEAVGIIGSLSFTAASFRRDDASRRVSNLLAITAAHRDIWTALCDRPELARVLSADVDLTDRPVTDEEALFVTFLILHLHTTHEAVRAGMHATRQAVAEDIRWFFALPVPRSVWEKSRSFQDPEFVRYVEDCFR